MTGRRQDDAVSGSIRAWMLSSAVMSTDTLFAQWLRDEMVKRGYLLEGPRAGGITRLAAATGISQATMSRTVRGQQEPSLDTLRKVGDAFGYELVQMMTFAGLAEHTVVGGAAQSDASSRFEVIDGGGSAPPRYDPEKMIAEFEAGIFRDNSEVIMWALDMPVEARLRAIWGKRLGQHDASEHAPQQHQNRPRESHGG